MRYLTRDVSCSAAKYDPTYLKSKYPHLEDDKFIPRLIEFRTELSLVSRRHRSLIILHSNIQLPPWFQYRTIPTTHSYSLCVTD